MKWCKLVFSFTLTLSYFNLDVMKVFLITLFSLLTIRLTLHAQLADSNAHTSYIQNNRYSTFKKNEIGVFLSGRAGLSSVMYGRSFMNFKHGYFTMRIGMTLYYPLFPSISLDYSQKRQKTESLFFRYSLNYQLLTGPFGIIIPTSNKNNLNNGDYEVGGISVLSFATSIVFQRKRFQYEANIALINNVRPFLYNNNLLILSPGIAMNYTF